MAAVIIVSSGTVTAPTGAATQRHLIQTTGGTFWYFFINSTSTTLLQTKFSTDGGATWTAGASLTLTNAHQGDGRDFSVAYANISATDVVHIAFTLKDGTPHDLQKDYRATISGTTITFGGANAVGSSTNTWTAGMTPSGCDIVIDTNNKPFILTPWGGGGGDSEAFRGTNADLGSSWTAGFVAGVNLDSSLTNDNNGCNVQSLASSRLLALWENGAKAETSSMSNVRWAIWNGAGSPNAWNTAADVFTSSFGTGVDPNNYGVAALSTSDIHCVIADNSANGAANYTHRRFNGAWNNGDAIAAQNRKAGSGMAMVSDGTNVWLFIIDSDGANTVRYNKWTSGSGWGGWTAFETSTQVRNYVGVCREVVGGVIGITWAQTNGSNFDNVFESLGGGIVTFANSNFLSFFS